MRYVWQFLSVAPQPPTFFGYLFFSSEILRGSSKQAHAEQSAMLEASLDAKEKSAQQGLWEKLRTQRSVTTVVAVATVPSANLSKWCKHEKHPSFRKSNSGLLWSAENGKTTNCYCCCFFYRRDPISLGTTSIYGTFVGGSKRQQRREHKN